MKKLICLLSLLVLTGCFLCTGFLQTTAAAAETEVLYAITDVNVRSGPGTAYDKLGVLHYGSAVECTGSENGWSIVVFEGAEGYVRSRYLSVSQAETGTAPAFDDTSVVFEAVDMTVYATMDVNVRSGPGSQYEAIGYCAPGEPIQCSGIGENGWDRVVYEGQTAYIRAKYLSDSKPKTKAASPAGLGENWYGRLYIPDLDIDVGLYYCSNGAENATQLAQSIVDAYDSAAFMEQVQVDGAIIADHNYQGFSAIRFCEAKETRAYIDYGTYTQEYICTAVGQGTNTGKDLIDWNGNSLNYGSIPGGLAMYTCNENWTNITITYWKAI